ncbi:MAG: 50S ribosomal protein L17 [Nitrospirota bacterium]
MRHKKDGRKLGRDSAHRKALFRNLVTSLFKHEKIETTLAKAKELRSISDKMITLAKKGSLHNRRAALSFIQEKDVVKKLFDDIGSRFTDRNGGYTRVIKTRRRLGDGAEMAIVELVVINKEEVEKKKAKDKDAA